MILNIRHTLGEDLNLGLHKLAVCSCNRHHPATDYSLEVCPSCSGYTIYRATSVTIIAEFEWPRQCHHDSEDRPDIAISNLPALNGRYVTTYVDYTLTNCQQIGFKTTAGAGKAGVAAKAAAQKKNNHYVNLYDSV